MNIARSIQKLTRTYITQGVIQGSHDDTIISVTVKFARVIAYEIY